MSGLPNCADELRLRREIVFMNAAFAPCRLRALVRFYPFGRIGARSLWS